MVEAVFLILFLFIALYVRIYHFASKHPGAVKALGGLLENPNPDPKSGTFTQDNREISYLVEEKAFSNQASLTIKSEINPNNKLFSVLKHTQKNVENREKSDGPYFNKGNLDDSFVLKNCEDPAHLELMLDRRMSGFVSTLFANGGESFTIEDKTLTTVFRNIAQDRRTHYFEVTGQLATFWFNHFLEEPESNNDGQ